MPLAKTHSVTLLGVKGHMVEVEADLAPGLPAIVITGLPDAAVVQSRDRIRAAILNSGLEWPNRRITIGLGPAWLPKQGSGHDLAMAIAILAAAQLIPPHALESTVFLGELGLDGRVRPIQGVLPAILAAVRIGVERIVIPVANKAEAQLFEQAQPGVITIIAVEALLSLVNRMRGQPYEDPLEPAQSVEDSPQVSGDLAEVVGQELGRCALEIAAAGGHHLALFGPPGAGKTMLAERLPGLLPPLSPEAALETMGLQSVAGVLPTRASLQTQAPYQAPHHTATIAALVGGGSPLARPGSVSLAHHGVLFLDEATEFSSRVLDALRQPLERGEIVLARAYGTVRYPALVQLIIAANPCPCGAARGSECSCAPIQRRRYLGRISGPLLDRIDIQVELAPVTPAALLADVAVESTEVVAKRVALARASAAERWQDCPWQINAAVPGSALRSRWRLPHSVTGVVDHALDSGQLTARGYDRVLRIAWSLCDLRQATSPSREDVAEALALRLRRKV